MARFEIGEAGFLLDGEPFRVLSGAIHYFRVRPGHWADRIAKARAMGLNTVETYIPWNFHAPTPDRFDIAGDRDFAGFLRAVHEAGMFAIVRPGPYICAEWDGGGLPAWLFADRTIAPRSTDPRFLAAVAGYFDAALPLVADAQIDRGGPVIMVQVENEYGAYGSDPGYLDALTAMTVDRGITVPLFTVDQPTDAMLSRGTRPGLLTTGSFGGAVAERLAVLRRHQPTGPLMCAEFWNGWFDHWGEHHHTTSAAESAMALDQLLAAGASVNIYMFHGGSDWGFTNGANHKGVYRSQVTSYDYDAPLAEDGGLTEKYAAYREVIARYAPLPASLPASTGPAPAFDVPFGDVIPLTRVRDRLGQWQSHTTAPTLDEVGQFHGLAVYRTDLGGAGGRLIVRGSVRDRATVSVDGVVVGTLQRDHHERVIDLPPGDTLELLVEDLGRVDYGPRIGEPKGLIGAVELDGIPLTGWSVLPLDLDRLAADLFDEPSAFTRGSGSGAAFRRAAFDLEQPVDLFLDTTGLGKGLVWVNGFLIGRYWDRGPQRTLYLPAPELRSGCNELVVLAIDPPREHVARFVSTPMLGQLDD